MKELAEALKARSGLRMRQGVVTAVDGATCSVLIGGSDVPVEGVQHLNSCAPAAGDVVWITSDGADLWIIGTHGDPPPIDPSRLPSFETYFTAADPAGAPAPVANLEGHELPTGVQLGWDLPPEALWRTWEVFEGDSADFAPDHPVKTVNTAVVTILHEQGSGPWFYKVRAINTRNEASTFADAGPFTVPTTTIPDGSLDITKFASGIIPPRVVDVLPDLPDPAFPAGSLVFLTTDGRLYRTTTGAAGTWENMVNAADLTGTIDASKIAAGSIGASLLDPSIKTIRPVDALPPLPDPEYPLGSVVLETADGTLYKASEAVDLVPVMSGPSAPSGAASASSEVSSTYAAWKAFDDDAGTKWYPSAAAGPWWLRYQFAIPRVITRYRLTPPGATYAPKAWTFEGSSDGADWTVLDTRADVIDWQTNTAKAFDCANEASYAYYRINCSASNGAVTCALVQFEMCGYTLPGAAPSAKVTLADLGDDVLAALVPLGTIVEWDEFTQGAIPAGYHLCDGSVVNGRQLPDLRDKFIVGSGAAYAAGATGGEATHKLLIGEMPSHLHAINHDHASATSGGASADHTHSGTTGGASADHNHSGTTGGQSASHTHAQGSHRHNATQNMMRADGAGTISATGRWGSAQSREISAGNPLTDFTDPGATGAASVDHTHGLTTGGRSADHSHSITTGGRSADHTHAVDLPNFTGSSGSAGGDASHENRPPYYALAFVMRVA